ncbi:hypothetical protein SV7mr_49580 [Stieleria bergensis]|uniref:Uncharacterized protein n=2 Tax=Stieleria bergensis TaxID=2528025 RepID=A0A517T203_9BACT|nr:hypothetical protein SV7mr_49580 [Planctomycetes bacterium SV_7m_r]
MCVTDTVFISIANVDTTMANPTVRPTSADLLYLHTQTLELLEDLHTAVKTLPLSAASDDANFDLAFGELDDLHDALDGLAARIRRVTTE